MNNNTCRHFYTSCASQAEVVSFSVWEHYWETLIVWRANSFQFRPKHVCERSLTPPSSAPYQPVYKRQLQPCDLFAFSCSGTVLYRCSADSPPLLFYASFCFMLSGINLFMDTFAFRLSRVSCWETGHLWWGPHTLCMWTKALGRADCTLAVWFANVAQQGDSTNSESIPQFWSPRWKHLGHDLSTFN